MIILDVNLVVDDENRYYCEGNELWFIIFGWWSLDLINDVGYWLIIVDFNGSSIFNEGYMVKMWWCVQYVYGWNSWDNEGWILLSFVLWEWCFRMLYTYWMDCSMLKMIGIFFGTLIMVAENWRAFRLNFGWSMLYKCWIECFWQEWKDCGLTKWLKYFFWDLDHVDRNLVDLWNKILCWSLLLGSWFVFNTCIWSSVIC